MVLGMILFPIMQEAVIDMNYTVWTFTGHEALAVLMPAIPLIFLVIFLTVPGYFIIDEVGGLKG